MYNYNSYTIMQIQRKLINRHYLTVLLCQVEVSERYTVIKDAQNDKDNPSKARQETNFMIYQFNLSTCF